MNRIFVWIQTRRSKINAFAPAFLSSYFLLLVIPYCTGRIPVLYQALCINVIGRVLFRLLPTAYMLLYSMLVGTANRSRIRWEWVFPMVALWAAFALAWIFTPDTYVFVSESWNRSLTYSRTTVGWLDTAIYFCTLIAETVLLILWISVLPDAVRGKNAIYVPMAIIVGFAWTAVVASAILEADLYIQLFRGGDHKLIRSFFSQKNEYGAFLFVGTFASVFLGFFCKGKARWVWRTSSFVLLGITFLVRCYTAFMSEIVVVLGLIMALIFALRRKNAPLTYGLLGMFLLAIVVGFGLCFVPQIRTTVPIFRIVYNSFSSIEAEVATRTVIWKHLADVADGPHIFLGITDGVSDAKLASLQIVDQEGVVAIFHNSYIAYLAIHGIAGLLVYFALIIKAIKQSVRFAKKNLLCSLFLIVLLIGYLLQGMAETYVLFLKLSVLTLPLTYVFFVFLPAMQRRDMYEI